MWGFILSQITPSCGNCKTCQAGPNSPAGSAPNTGRLMTPTSARRRHEITGNPRTKWRFLAKINEHHEHHLSMNVYSWDLFNDSYGIFITSTLNSPNVVWFCYSPNPPMWRPKTCKSMCGSIHPTMPIISISKHLICQTGKSMSNIYNSL